jgi:hypothetical protein
MIGNVCQLVYTRYKVPPIHPKTDGLYAIRQPFVRLYKHKPFPYKKLIILFAATPVPPQRFFRRAIHL